MLAELQRRFARELLAGGARLAIHRENVLAALADALAAIHPVCVRLVGPEFFRALARRFALEVESRSPDLNDYGAELGAFLERFEPARALPYLPDVARLEWRLHRARHCTVSDPIDAARLARVPDERRGGVVFRLAPGTGLLASPWPIDRIFAANRAPEAGADLVSLDAGGARLVVAREPEGAALSSLSEPEWRLLSGLARGLPLERAARGWQGSPEALGGFLARASERRWLAGFSSSG